MDLKGICLRSINYKEQDKLLTLATFQKGIITVKATGARSQKAKLKAGCMPMVFGEFSLVEGKGGLILKGVDIQENFYNCWTDTQKNLAAMLVLEILEKVSLKEDDITKEMLLALNALKVINYDNVYPFAVSTWFLLKEMNYIGVDYTVEDIPENVKEALDMLQGINSEDIETLDMMTTTIDRALGYLNLIFKRQMNTEFKLIKEINSLLKK